MHLTSSCFLVVVAALSHVFLSLDFYLNTATLFLVSSHFPHTHSIGWTISTLAFPFLSPLPLVDLVRRFFGLASRHSRRNCLSPISVHFEATIVLTCCSGFVCSSFHDPRHFHLWPLILSMTSETGLDNMVRRYDKHELLRIRGHSKTDGEVADRINRVASIKGESLSCHLTPVAGVSS